MRLIDAEKLEGFLDGLIRDEWNKNASTSWADALEEVSELVKSIPESVVRCKDCEFCKPIGGNENAFYKNCFMHEIAVFDEAYCAWGERREDAVSVED